MSSGEKISLAEGRILVREVERVLLVGHGKQTASRWMVAGSIRRKRPEVGDVEIVAIPSYGLLSERLDLLLKHGVIAKAVKIDKNKRETTRWGDRYRAFTLSHTVLSNRVAQPERLAQVHVELFIADFRNWGVVLAIRTGSWEFSRDLVTRIKRSGVYRVGEGYLREHFKDGLTKKQIRAVPIVDCPDEETFFKAASYDSVIPPEEREVR